ncbi:MAG: DNA topoisomerase I, partial [Clostridia bacterium]|nr:DNA topoisomerase I [Clostridia bacterium]
MADLIIVESPEKAKTIKKFLGSGYEVIASKGHVRDLPEKRLSVDIKKNFKPVYEVIQGKEALVDELIKKAAKSEHVYLATDPDREGEAISWHLAYLLNMDLNEENRVTFYEITKTGVENGMAAPRRINLALVNAQQARRILDRLVGYKLSPFVSQKIR